MDEDQSNLFWNKSKNPGQKFFIDDDQKRLNQKKIEKFETEIFFESSLERFSFFKFNTHGRLKVSL